MSVRSVDSSLVPARLIDCEPSESPLASTMIFALIWAAADDPAVIADEADAPRSTLTPEVASNQKNDTLYATLRILASNALSDPAILVIVKSQPLIRTNDGVTNISVCAPSKVH